MTPIERVLAALRDRGFSPSPCRDGHTCRCPAHDDRNPSLSIATGEDGRVLILCFAGCTPAEIVGAIGLELRDLFPAPTDGPPTKGVSAPRAEGRRASPTRRGASAQVYPTAAAAVAELEGLLGPRERHWTYHDAVGDPALLIVRFPMPCDPDDPKAKPGKTFRPVSRIERGWIIGDPPGLLPLYRLPDLLASGGRVQFHVFEGEKTAEAARTLGLPATTSAHGSRAAEKSDWSPAAGRDVLIYPDRDDAGERFAIDVARLAFAAGAGSVRLVRLWARWLDLPKGGDLADLVERSGGDAESLDALSREVMALADAAGPLEPESFGDGDAATRPVYEPFPVDCIPEPLATLIEQGARAIGCDAAYIALPLLAGAASAVGNCYRIEVKRGSWSEPAVLWTAIIGNSGSMKTPAFKLAMRPIRRAQDKAFVEHGAATAAWDSQQLECEARIAAWKRDAGTEAADPGPPPEKPPPPVARRYLVSDITVEALASLLSDNPRGILLARDELSGWFGSFNAYKKRGADEAQWLSMHNAEELTVDRKTGDRRTIHVPLAAVSITGGIQPEILRRALGEQHFENGLAARLLVTFPPERPKRWTEADLSPTIESAVADVFARLLSLGPDIDGDGCPAPRLLPMAPAAKAIWIEFYNAHAAQQCELDGNLSAAWSKLEAYAARLALIIHMLAWAASGEERSPGPVSEMSMAAAIRVTRWFAAEARRVYAVLDESDADRELRHVEEWIDRRGGTASPRDVAHGMRRFRGETDRARAAIDRLVEAGRARWEAVQNPRGGPTSQRVRLINPDTVTETRFEEAVMEASGDGVGATKAVEERSKPC